MISMSERAAAVVFGIVLVRVFVFFLDLGLGLGFAAALELTCAPAFLIEGDLRCSGAGRDAVSSGGARRRRRP